MTEKTDHTKADLHRCKGCEFIVSPDKCSIFMQSCAMMETMLVFRKCRFKEKEITMDFILDKVRQSVEQCKYEMGGVMVCNPVAVVVMIENALKEG